MQYIGIRDAILEQIDQGVLTPGQKLPAERQLAETFHTTRVTLREALALLEADGTIYREDRRGWFIAAPRFWYPVGTLTDISGLALQQGRQLEVINVSQIRTLAHQAATQQLQLPPFSELITLEGTVLLESRPIATLTYWLRDNPVSLSVPSTEPDGRIPLNAQYQPVGMTEIQQYQVTVCGLSGAIARRLRATTGTAGILTEKILGNTEHQPMMVERLHWRHDAVMITDMTL